MSALDQKQTWADQIECPVLTQSGHSSSVRENTLSIIGADG
jgi:hypothetical protein